MTSQLVNKEGGRSSYYLARTTSSCLRLELEWDIQIDVTSLMTSMCGIPGSPISDIALLIVTGTGDDFFQVVLSSHHDSSTLFPLRLIEF